MLGADLRTVQDLMGHKIIQMTVRYSHLIPKHTLAIVELLNGNAANEQTDPRTDTRAEGPLLLAAVCSTKSFVCVML